MSYKSKPCSTLQLRPFLEVNDLFHLHCNSEVKAFNLLSIMKILKGQKKCSRNTKGISRSIYLIHNLNMFQAIIGTRYVSPFVKVAYCEFGFLQVFSQIKTLQVKQGWKFTFFLSGTVEFMLKHEITKTITCFIQVSVTITGFNMPLGSQIQSPAQTSYLMIEPMFPC